MNKDLVNILTKLKQLRGIDFLNYQPRMLDRRVTARLAQLGMDDYALYLQRLENEPTECDQLIDVIAINVSSFFRDPIVYEIIAQKVLPELIEQKNHPGLRELRVWSAGCAAGEEPYSLAILFHEELKEPAKNWKTYLFGTDIDNNALQRAAKAIYPRESLVDTKFGILDKYFEQVEDQFKLNTAICDNVRFSQDDLTSKKTDSPTESVFGGFDLIFCRNVLIYFNRDLQKQVMSKFLRSLTPGGYLVLGSSETLAAEIAPWFKTVDFRNKIYQKLPGKLA
jgi:chemotaxis methyl-accepting protein methylase